MRSRAFGIFGVPAAGLVLAMQLTWVRSGAAGRNSYEMFRSAQRLGLDELTPFRVVWFLLPVFCLGAMLMVGLGSFRMAAGFIAVASIIGGAASIAVFVSGLGAGLGAPLAAAFSVAGILAAIVSRRVLAGDRHHLS